MDAGGEVGGCVIIDSCLWSRPAKDLSSSVCVCCTICKATDAQFAKPQTHILQSNSNVQSTAEISCLPCSVAVTLRAIHSLIRSLEGTHALEADFLLNFRMAVLRVGGEGRRAGPWATNSVSIYNV